MNFKAILEWLKLNTSTFSTNKQFFAVFLHDLILHVYVLITLIYMN